MAQRPQAKLGVKVSNYQGVYDLGVIVQAAMLAAVANFPTPVPTMTLFLTHLGTLSTAISTWGPPTNRGSHADLVALRAATRVVYNDMLQLQGYVMSLVDLTTSYVDQTAFILTSGFAVKNAATPQGVLNAVEGFQQMFQSTVSIYTPKLKWRAPLGLLSRGNVKSYDVYRNNANDLLTAYVIGSVTATSFIDNDATPGTVYFYWVRGINASGKGVASASVRVSVPL